MSIKYIKGRGQFVNPRLFIIGEAPGAEEVKQGRPFVGKSGQLLDEALKHIGAKEFQVYKTNVVKVRPKGNKTPTYEEVRSWLPILNDEIYHSNPKVVVLLGRTAVKSIFGVDVKVKNITRTFSLYSGGICHYIPLYHPSYVLRGFMSKEKYFQSFEVLKEFL